MGSAESKITQVRFIFEDEFTQVYVYAEASDDGPICVQGWHHKNFPASKSAIDILKDEISDYLLWPIKGP